MAVKICSPINPTQSHIRLSEWHPHLRERAQKALNSAGDDVEDDGHKKPPNEDIADETDEDAPNGPSNLKFAIALYKQEQKRWGFQQVESCYAAYQVCPYNKPIRKPFITDQRLSSYYRNNLFHLFDDSVDSIRQLESPF